MEEHLTECISELKRLDHLIFVSLKYTRTVDVLRSAVKRMIDCLSFGIDCLLLFKKEAKEIKELPKVPTEKISLMLKLYKDDEDIIECVNIHKTLRKLSRARYEKREEYRRHVTMISYLDDGSVEEIHIDRLEEYFPKIKNFVLKTKKCVIEDNKSD